MQQSCPLKLREIVTFQIKHKVKQFITTMPVMQKILRTRKKNREKGLKIGREKDKFTEKQIYR
jgi:hypothetical protein